MSRPSTVSFWTRLPRLTLVLLTLGALSAGGAIAELDGPTANDRTVTQTVTTLLRSHHLSKKPLDDEISARTMDTFLKLWDSSKVYFYQSDIDEFMKQKHQLDDQIKEKNVSFAYNVFERFKQRVNERVNTIDELLAMEHDFTVDEELIIDSDAASYPKTPEEARELWRKRIKYDLLVLKVDGTTGQEAREKLKRRYHGFAKRMSQTDDSELLEMYLGALTSSYDPHTSYMSPETLENFEIAMRLNLEGIGAALISEDGYTVVSSIIPGGAADKDGRLHPKDKIVGVGQEKGDIEDTVDMKLSDVVERIRGKKGTMVRLQVIPAGQADRKIYELKREQIALVDKEARSQIVEGESGGMPYRIGVINLPSFYLDMDGQRSGAERVRRATSDVRRLLADFRSKQVDAVVVDLRRNGGGSLPEAIGVTGLFIDEGPVVLSKDSANSVQTLEDPFKGVEWDGPLVVVIDKFSASASEIFAGAIQDYNRGIVVGDKSTHGKGTVQSLLDISNQLFGGAFSPSRLLNAQSLGAVKVTMQMFYRPSGDSTQNRGVLSDIELPSLTTHLDVGEADLDFAMDFDRVDSATYTKANKVDKGIIDRLKTLSTERVQASEDFQKVLKNIARYQEQKSRKTVTLNEEKFVAERAELNAEKEEAKELEEDTNPDKPVFDTSNYYNSEIVNITVDYLQMINPARVTKNR